MNPENITAVIRPRSAWEAADLGCVLVRRHTVRFLSAWCLTVFPIWAILCALFWNSPGWAMVLIWWLKPVYDRVPLFIVSRGLFGPPPTLRETLRAWPSLLIRDLAWALTLGRISLRRSFEMPVAQLEGLRGTARRQRAVVLGYEGGGQASNVTVAFLALEVAVALALSALAEPFIPESGAVDWQAAAASLDGGGYQFPNSFVWFANGIYMLTITLLEPFYVGAGFGLYINSRTHLEGWDIELAFKSMSARLAGIKARIIRPSTAALIATLCALALLPSSAHAQDVEIENFETTRDAVERILAEPEFEVHKSEQKHWVSDEKPKTEYNGTDSVDGIGWVMGIARVIFWLAVAALLYWLGWLIYKNRDFFLARGRRSEVPEPERARTVLGMDVGAESLPADIAASARALWREGRAHEALRLLYRGSLSWFVHRADLPVRESDTENDCVRHADALPDPGQRSYFNQLTETWVALAYGGMAPHEEGMASLCDSWPFGGAERRKP
jgi:hypothetical protein